MPKDKFSDYLDNDGHVKKGLTFYQILTDKSQLSLLERYYSRDLFQYHPIRNKDSLRAKKCTQLIVHAFGILSDPDLSNEYRQDSNAEKFAFKYDENFDYTTINVYIKKRINKLLDELDTSQNDDGIAIELSDLFRVWIRCEYSAQSFNHLLQQFIDKATTGAQFYALYLIHAEDIEVLNYSEETHLKEEGFLQSAARCRQPQAMLNTIERAFTGFHYKESEKSIRWALKAFRYLDEIVIPALVSPKNIKLKSFLCGKLGELRETFKQTLPLVIPADESIFDHTVQQMIEFQRLDKDINIDKSFDFSLDETMFDEELLPSQPQTPKDPYAELTCAIRKSKQAITKAILKFTNDINFIEYEENDFPFAYSVLGLLNEAYKEYERQCRDLLQYKRAAVSFRNACTTIISIINENELNEEPMLGDWLYSILTCIINVLNHVISLPLKVWSHDMSSTFFACKEQTTPAIREAYDEIMKVPSLINECEQINNLLDSSNGCSL